MDHIKDFTRMEEVYELMENLGIKSKSKFAELCGVSRVQFGNWEKKGRVPNYRLSFLREAIIRTAKEEFDRKIRPVLKA